MKKAIWIIAVCEIIRSVLYMVQLTAMLNNEKRIRKEREEMHKLFEELEEKEWAGKKQQGY